MFSERKAAGRYVAAYRKWLGVDAERKPTSHRRKKATDDELGFGESLELAILSVKDSNARCRLLRTHGEITLRSSGLWNVVPGEIVTVTPTKRWRYAGHPYLSGEVAAVRLDVKALGLVPLRLQPFGEWDPADEYWGEEGEPVPEWARPIIARGPRPCFEMEQVLPGLDDEGDIDPLIDAIELHDSGDSAGARRMLMRLLETDLRCLDAHAHLGNWALEHFSDLALRHYEVGVRLGELSIGDSFEGVLPWGLIDNRPFLRCLHGKGLALWRLGRFDDATSVFVRMLWLNPSDNQGVRFLLPSVRIGEAWDAREE